MADPLDELRGAVDQLETDLRDAATKAIAVTEPRSSLLLAERRRVLGELKAWMSGFWARHYALLAAVQRLGHPEDAAELFSRLGTIAEHASGELAWRIEQGLARFGVARAIIDPRLARPRLIDRGIVAHPQVADRGLATQPAVD
jgi:hypothetical protein